MYEKSVEQNRIYRNKMLKIFGDKMSEGGDNGASTFLPIVF